MVFPVSCDDLHGNEVVVNVPVDVKDLAIPANPIGEKWDLKNLSKHDLMLWYMKNEDYLDNFFESYIWDRGMDYLDPAL